MQECDLCLVALLQLDGLGYRAKDMRTECTGESQLTLLFVVKSLTKFQIIWRAKTIILNGFVALLV